MALEISFSPQFFDSLEAILRNTGTRNTGTGSCFAEKGIELQAEMLAAQFFYKFS